VDVAGWLLWCWPCLSSEEVKSLHRSLVDACSAYIVKRRLIRMDAERRPCLKDRRLFGACPVWSPVWLTLPDRASSD
jgi:hypothetical protein